MSEPASSSEDRTRLFNLRVTVDRIEGRSVCGLEVGDYFELVDSAQLRIPAGRHFCIFALAAVLPLLAAKQRLLPPGDADAPAEHWVNNGRRSCRQFGRLVAAAMTSGCPNSSSRSRRSDIRRSTTPPYRPLISTEEPVAAATPTLPERCDDPPGAASGSPRRLPSIAVVGLIGIVVVFLGITTMFAFEQAPFYDADEKAHLGYAHEIAGFRLPEIAGQPDVPSSATQWQAERATGRDDRYRGVWVANHPPLHYVVVGPLIWLADATDRPDGGLLWMRLANIAFAAAGVVFTYLLATELSGGLGRIGLAAAATVALVPQGHTYFSRGLNDGLAFAAGTGLVWAALRCLRGADTRGGLILLGTMAAVAAGARTATMALAVTVVGAVAANRLLRHEPEPWRDRARAASLTVAIGLGPAAVLFGWFYIRMHVLYGDFGASDHLLGYFGRASQGSVLDVMTRGHVWVDLYQRMTSTAPLSWAWPRYANLVAVVAVAGLVVAVVRVRPGVSRQAFAVCGLAVAVITMTVAQHVAGGGSLYPRYFFPVLGVVAALIAVAFDRLIPRLLPAALLAAMGWWAIRQMPIGVDPANTLRPRDEGDRPPVLLRTLPVGDGWRVVAAGLIGVGVIILVIAAAAAIARWRRRGAVAGRTYPLTS